MTDLRADLLEALAAGATDDAILALDRDGRAMLCNEGAGRIRGKTPLMSAS